MRLQLDHLMYFLQEMQNYQEADGLIVVKHWSEVEVFEKCGELSLLQCLANVDSLCLIFSAFQHLPQLMKCRWSVCIRWSKLPLGRRDIAVCKPLRISILNSIWSQYGKLYVQLSEEEDDPFTKLSYGFENLPKGKKPSRKIIIEPICSTNHTESELSTGKGWIFLFLIV